MAMQVVDAMAPFASAGIVDMPKLANYVLQYGFGIKNAGSFIMQPELPPEPITPQGAPEPVEGMPPQGMPPGMPEGMPQGMPPEMGGGLPPELAQLPPEVLAQLMQQMQGGGMPPQGM